VLGTLLCHASACAWRVRRATWTQRPPKLFCQLDGRTLSSRMSGTLRRLADKAGVERRVHPHALRHTYSAEWLGTARP